MTSQKKRSFICLVSLARVNTLVTLDAEDQKRLYPIELLNGRTITQEVVKGFEPDFGIAVDNQQKAEAKARRAEREARDAADPRNRDKKPIRDTVLHVTKVTALRLKNNTTANLVSSVKMKMESRFLKEKPANATTISMVPRSDAEKAARTPYSSKPKFFGDKEKRSDERKSFDGEKKPLREKKPFGDKKAYGDKKPFGDKKPYGDKPAFGEKTIR